jgi:hypothetical protein
MLEFLKKISPAHEPVAYLYLLLVVYQLFIQHQPLNEEWIQYISELVLAGVGRQVVKPLAKLKDADNAGGN